MTLRLLPAHERDVGSGADLAPAPGDEEVVPHDQDLGGFSRIFFQHAHLQGQTSEAADVGQVPEDCASDLPDGRHVWHRGSLGSERDDGLVMLVTFGACSAYLLRVSVAHETAAPQLGQPHPQAADVKPQHVAGVQGGSDTRFAPGG
jgi:hypothetical protein